MQRSWWRILLERFTASRKRRAIRAPWFCAIPSGKPAPTFPGIALTATLLLSSLVPAAADDGAIIDRWYSALLVADRTELSDLLSDDVRMKLDDVGIVQTKQDFIASIDEWQSAVAGAAIRHRIEKSEDGETTVLACYDFPSNDTLMRETFTVAGGRIVASTQRAVAQDCSAY